MSVVDLRMPDLAEAGEAIVARWSVEAGDQVAAGQLLAEAETDKASFEIEAPIDGQLIEILVPVGDSAEPGAVIGRIRQTA